MKTKTVWQCARCNVVDVHTKGCGMPNFSVPVHYDDGTVDMVKAACPLIPVIVRVPLKERLLGFLRRFTR